MSRPCLLSVRPWTSLTSSSGHVCPPDDGLQHRLVAFARGGGDIVAQSEPATLQGGIELVAVVGHVLIQVHDSSVKLAHVLNNWFGHETSFDKILQDAFRYPLRVLDIALAARQLLDEIRIYQFELH